MSARVASLEAVSEALGYDARTVRALERLVLTLADSKRLMGIRYSDWLLGAPSLETGIACSSMAQDEWGHARLLYSMLKELGYDPVEVEHNRSDERYTSIDGLDRSPEDWPGLVAVAAVVDEALRVRLAGFGAGGFELAQSRVGKMLAEEELHRDFSEAWFNRLAASVPAAALLRAAVIELLPGTLAWLAAEDDGTAALVEAGLTEAPSVLLERFAGVLGPMLDLLGVELPNPRFDEGWDAERGRGPGHPVGDALERARGDKNRDLFVE